MSSVSPPIMPRNMKTILGKMYATVLFVGVPEYISSIDVVQSLKKLLDVRTGLFQVRDLRRVKNRTYKWQFAVDFESSHDATCAQRLLHGYNYVLPNGIAYVICAKLTDGPRLTREDKCLVPIGDLKNGDVEDWAVFGLDPKASDGLQTTYCAFMDAQVNIINKQKMLVQAKRELLSEQRQLWKEHNIKDDSDSDHEGQRRHKRRRKSRRKKSIPTDFKDDARTKFMLRDFPNDGLILPEANTPVVHTGFGTKLAVSEPFNNDKLLYDSRNYYATKNTDFKTHNKYLNVKEVTSTNKIIQNNKSKHDLKDHKLEIKEAIVKIVKEIDVILDQLCYEKNINILEKGLNFTIMKKVKGIIKGRINNFQVINYMSSAGIVLYYRSFYSKNDDRLLVEKILDDYIVENPHIKNTRFLEKVSSSESSLIAADSEENIMWRAVDEVLRDVDIEMLSSDYDRTNTNIDSDDKKQANVDTLKMKELINISHDHLVDTKNNTQIEVIVMLKNNIKKEDIGVKEEANKEVNIKTDISVNNVVNKHKISQPTFYITVKALLDQMKLFINQFVKTTGVTNLRNIVKNNIKKKIIVLLKGKDYMKSAEITKLFREHYPRINDKEFIRSIIKDKGIENCFNGGKENKA